MGNFDTMLWILIATSSVLSVMSYAGMTETIRRLFWLSLVSTVIILPLWLLQYTEVLNMEEIIP